MLCHCVFAWYLYFNYNFLLLFKPLAAFILKLPLNNSGWNDQDRTLKTSKCVRWSFWTLQLNLKIRFCSFFQLFQQIKNIWPKVQICKQLISSNVKPKKKKSLNASVIFSMWTSHHFHLSLVYGYEAVGVQQHSSCSRSEKAEYLFGTNRTLQCFNQLSSLPGCTYKFDFAQVYIYLRNNTIYSMLNSLLRVLYDFGRPRGNFRSQFVSLGAVFPDIWLQHCCTAMSSHVTEHSFYLLFWNYYKTWNAFFLGSASSAHFPGFLYFKLRSYKRKNRYFRLSTGGLQIFIF